MSEPYDIVIVGGGMVGASLACALTGSPAAPGFRTLLIEGFPLLRDGAPPRYQPSFDARSTALSLSSARIFEELGLWRAIAAHAQPINRIHVSDRGRYGSTVLDACEESLPAMGYVVENHWLGTVLHGGLRACRGLELLAPARVTGLAPAVDGALLSVEHAGERSEVRARLAVIADGARSGLAAAAGIGIDVRDYAQAAVIANVAHREAHRGRAFERFTDHGPLAMLPLPDEPQGRARSALVWVREPQEAERLAAVTEGEFLAELQRCFGYRLGRLERSGSRHVYPLSLLCAREQARSGLVLLGNAAHALHPVAGQGFNLSLRDAAALAEVLREAEKNGESLGSLAVLERFVARQRTDQERTIGFSDLLPRLFGSGALHLAAARDAGLIAMQLSGHARSLFVRQATGLADR